MIRTRLGRWSLIVLAGLALSLSGERRAEAGATLALDYVLVTLPSGPYTYQYDFTLKVDESGGPLQPGDGWGWIIFGDAFESTSPLDDFQGIDGSIVGGPWTYFTTSFGGHNGPTLGGVTANWYPADASETVTWSGYSNVGLQQGELLFSALGWDGSVDPVYFATGTQIAPEPSTLVAGCVGAAALVIARRRKRLAA